MKQSYRITALAYQRKIRAVALDGTLLVQEAQSRHQTLPTASAALGRALMGGLLLASGLKQGEKYAIRISGHGPIGEMFIDATAEATVRGYVQHPLIDLPLNQKGKLDVARAVGTTGSLSVIRISEDNQHFTGQVPLVSGEVAEDFTHYFVQSEQIPSSVALGVLVNPDHRILAAGGFLIQAMPGCDDATLAKVEQVIRQSPSISTLIVNGKTPEDILKSILGEIEILEKKSVLFQCTCSASRVEKTLLLLGKQEIQQLIETQHGAEIICNFCNQRYQLEEGDLHRLILELSTH
jgi:molecular chaperone Hsp33